MRNLVFILILVLMGCETAKDGGGEGTTKTSFYVTSSDIPTEGILYMFVRNATTEEIQKHVVYADNYRGEDIEIEVDAGTWRKPGDENNGGIYFDYSITFFHVNLDGEYSCGEVHAIPYHGNRIDMGEFIELEYIDNTCFGYTTGHLQKYINDYILVDTPGATRKSHAGSRNKYPS